MIRALVVEVVKLKRASLPLWSVITVVLAPAMSNIFAYAQDSGGSRLSWPAFFELGSMTMGTWWGILLFGLITAFVFGREYAEGVSPSMLTAPMRREYFVIAKFVVLAVWVVALALLSLVAQGFAATALGLDGFAWSEVWPAGGDVLTVALLILLTQPLIAFVAVASRGVFAPMILSAAGFLAGMLGGIAGWGDWLPWAMPTAIGGTFLGSVIPVEAELTAGSWAISGALCLAGVVATMLWVNRADSKVSA